MQRKGGFLDGLNFKKHKMARSVKKRKPRTIPSNKVTKKELWNNRRKKGRLIVRNLPFKITEDQLREHFMSFGELKDVSLLRRADGKLVGCGFVEFVSRENATKAIAETSGKPLLNRPIIVDWAIPKDVFESTQKATEEKVKEEIKEETLSSDEDVATPSIKRDSNKAGDSVKKSESDSGSGGDSDEESVSEAGSINSEDGSEDEAQDKKHKPPPQCDVQEGRTIFLKNVPFTATQDELKNCMLKFGPVVYALICTDPLTEHSKGTAFVKFKNTDHAAACLAADSSQLELGTATLEPHLALDKKQLHNQAEAKKSDKNVKDGRNLYLIKEGVVQAGSIAAKGVSTADMSKRLQLEQWKTQILRNLSMVVSRTRLVVHNLPPTLEDEALRNIVIKNAPPGARITEARVMRDLRHVDEKGRGVSKEFAFVSFIRHEDALVTLRAMNNNPTIFTRQKRPIVGFSIENKAILNAKQRRMEMSRNKNPYFQREKKAQSSGGGIRDNRGNAQRDVVQESGSQHFSGLEAHRSQTVKFPTRGTLRSQAAVHRHNVQQERRQSKLEHKVKLNKRDKMKNLKEQSQTVKVKSKKQGRDDHNEEAFDSLVNEYRQKLGNTVDLKKWYE